MSDIVYLNGSFLERDKAFISPDDRGFNFADGVYEVVKFYQGKAFRYDDHLSRLKRSLAEIRILFDACDELKTVFQKLLEENHLSGENAGVYLQISRGCYPRMHRFPESCTPTVYASAFPFPSFQDHLNNGISVITAEDIRWLRCDIKSVALLPNTLMFQKAWEKGAGEVIFIRDGIVTEASHSNVMGVKNGVVCTHPDSNLILPGITKKVIREICLHEGIPLVEEGMTEQELRSMDEILIVGTGSEITPAVLLDGKPVGNGKPGPVARQLQKLFFEQVNKAELKVSGIS